MYTTKKKFERVQGLDLTTIFCVGLAALLVSRVDLSFAQRRAHRTFRSAEEASQALFVAVQNNNEQAIMQILGCGKELLLSDDEIETKHDRELFAQKYQEMHRLVREPDGTTFLYIGAENWPFPVPLVAKGGRWYFDSDAGAQEILFRRVGENETTAIETCRALVLASKEEKSRPTGDDPIDQYARALSSQVANGGSAAANGEKASAPFHGYYFRTLAGQGKASNLSKNATAGLAFVAYPGEYRLSGVMTFLVTPENVVYEKDLGPDTEGIAKAMTAWKPDPSWHIAE